MGYFYDLAECLGDWAQLMSPAFTKPALCALSSPMYAFTALVLFLRARQVMKRQDNRQVLVMLATSVLIFCVLHPYPGYICIGLESLICLVLFSVLILFIAKQTAALYDLVLASALCFAGYVFLDTASRQLMEDVSVDTFSIGDPALPFRFQLPPPALSA